MYPWFTLNFNTLFFSLLGAWGTYYASNKVPYLFVKPDRRCIILLILLYIWIGLHSTFFGLVNQAFNFYIISKLLSMRLEPMINTFQSLTKWFAILLIISLLFFILHYVGVPLPHQSLWNPELKYDFDNYYFFVCGTEELLPRFRSIFGEPGHLTQGLILLLVANLFNLRDKYVLILFIAQIATFSLAGYISLFVAYTVLSLLNGKSMKKLLMPIILLGVIVYFCIHMSEYSFFYEIIGYRFNPDIDTGRNDRNSYETQKLFDAFCQSISFLWGADSQTLSKIDGSGYRVYLMHYGLIGLLFTILFYWKYTLTRKCKFCLVLFVVFLLEQYQGAASMWFCVLIGYILGVNYIQYEKLQKRQLQ